MGDNINFALSYNILNECHRTRFSNTAVLNNHPLDK